METELLNCMYQYQALLLEHFHADVTISISSSESIEKIHCLYAQALEAMEYAEETNDSVIFYSRIPKRVLQGSNLVNAEYQMLNCIVTFDYKNAVPAIAALFSACGADRDDLAKEKGRLHSLCYLFAGIADTLVQRYDLGEEGAQDFKAALLQAKTLDSMEKACIQLMARVDQHTHQRREGVQEEIIHQALQYIQDHYSSPNLSVTSIADHFKIALPRLSRQFKEFQGEGMLDYINRLRILRAKQLINEEKMTVKDASESVGFTSTQTFIRVFKKYEGTTPGKLKKK